MITLRGMAEQGLSAREIYQSGELLSRTCEVIRKQLNLGSVIAAGRRAIVMIVEQASDSFVQTKNSVIVQTIEPASEALWL